jgi:hypothetical protein
MNIRSLKIFSTGLLSIMMITVTSFPAFGYLHDDGGCVATATTMEQLRTARQATAKFQNTAAAEKAGYTNINLFVTNMGDHWVNVDLVGDGIFDPAKPEALVYADLGNGRLELVAVEYLAPYVADAPPSGFSGNCDQWSPFGPGPNLWTLHAWIWQPNISGTFAKFNPLVP